MICPICKQMNTGKVGTQQYYCWQCLIEFKLGGKNTTKLFYVNEDGSLLEFTRKEKNSFCNV